MSLGRLRLNEVQVIGEVEYPGVYQVSSLATALDALYQAGGPRPREASGPWRFVAADRGPVLDLYDYLLAAQTGDDVRLEQGDIVFVPLAGARVRVEGAVPRNAIFELSGDETLSDVIGFAGGSQAPADLARVRIDRILPPEQRTAGRERVLLDVDLVAAEASNTAVPLRDGDDIRVPEIGEERKNRVVIAGSVLHPGAFELRADMTV